MTVFDSTVKLQLVEDAVEGRISLGWRPHQFLDYVREKYVLEAQEVLPFIKREAARLVKAEGISPLVRSLMYLVKDRYRSTAGFRAAFDPKARAPAWFTPGNWYVYVNFCYPSAFHPVILRGSVLHELGHALFTSDAWSKDPRMRPSIESLVNILEDRRIEAKVGEDVVASGGAVFTEKARTYVEGIYSGASYADPMDLLYPLSLVPCPLYAEINEEGRISWERFLENFDIRFTPGFPGERELVEAWVSAAAEAVAAPDTETVIGIADEFERRFKHLCGSSLEKGDGEQVKRVIGPGGFDMDPSSGSGADEPDMEPGEWDEEGFDLGNDKEVDRAAETEAKKNDSRPFRSLRHIESRRVGDKSLNVIDPDWFCNVSVSWLDQVQDGLHRATATVARINSTLKTLEWRVKENYNNMWGRLDFRRAVKEEAIYGRPVNPFRSDENKLFQAPLLALDVVIDTSGSMNVLIEGDSGTQSTSAIGAAAAIGGYFMGVAQKTPWVDAHVYLTKRFGSDLYLAQVRDPQDLVHIVGNWEEGFCGYEFHVPDIPNLLVVITDGYFTDKEDFDSLRRLSSAGTMTVGLYVGSNNPETLEEVEANLSVFDRSLVTTELADVYSFLQKFLGQEIRARLASPARGKFALRRRNVRALAVGS